jgi:hypothetical protein
MLVRICAPRGSYPGAIGTNLSMLFGEVPFWSASGAPPRLVLGQSNSCFHARKTSRKAAQACRVAGSDSPSDCNAGKIAPRYCVVGSPLSHGFEP